MKIELLVPVLVLSITGLPAMADESNRAYPVTITNIDSAEVQLIPAPTVDSDAVIEARRIIREALQEMSALDSRNEEHREARRGLVRAIREARQILVESRETQSSEDLSAQPGPLESALLPAGDAQLR